MRKKMQKKNAVIIGAKCHRSYKICYCYSIKKNTHIWKCYVNWTNDIQIEFEAVDICQSEGIEYDIWEIPSDLHSIIHVTCICHVSLVQGH